MLTFKFELDSPGFHALSIASMLIDFTMKNVQVFQNIAERQRDEPRRSRRPRQDNSIDVKFYFCWVECDIEGELHEYWDPVSNYEYNFLCSKKATRCMNYFFLTAFILIVSRPINIPYEKKISTSDRTSRWKLTFPLYGSGGL